MELRLYDDVAQAVMAQVCCWIHVGIMDLE
jgi:hypothetical protein